MVVGHLYPCQIAWGEFLCQEVGHLTVGWFGMIVYAQHTCHHKPGMAIEVYVAFHAQYAYAHCLGLLQGILQQLQSVATALVLWMNTDGAKGPCGQNDAICLDKGSL